MKWSRYPPDVLPAWVAEMDFPLAPAVHDAARAVIDTEDLGYCEPDGLAEAFAGWATRYQAWRPDPALACPVGDVMAGVEAALRVLTEPGDCVVLLTPAYRNVPGLKCALLQAQPATAQVIAAVPQYERLRPSVPGVAASIAAWTDDGGWLDELRVHLDRTRTELADWIRRTPGVQAHPGQAGYLAWLDLRDAHLGDDPAAVLLEPGHLAVSPGHTFALPTEQGNRVRWSVNRSTCTRFLPARGSGTF